MKQKNEKKEPEQYHDILYVNLSKDFKTKKDLPKVKYFTPNFQQKTDLSQEVKYGHVVVYQIIQELQKGQYRRVILDGHSNVNSSDFKIGNWKKKVSIKTVIEKIVTFVPTVDTINISTCSGGEYLKKCEFKNLPKRDLFIISGSSSKLVKISNLVKNNTNFIEATSKYDSAIDMFSYMSTKYAPPLVLVSFIYDKKNTRHDKITLKAYPPKKTDIIKNLNDFMVKVGTQKANGKKLPKDEYRKNHIVYLDSNKLLYEEELVQNIIGQIRKTLTRTIDNKFYKSNEGLQYVLELMKLSIRGRRHVDVAQECMKWVLQHNVSYKKLIKPMIQLIKEYCNDMDPTLVTESEYKALNNVIQYLCTSQIKLFKNLINKEMDQAIISVLSSAGKDFEADPILLGAFMKIGKYRIVKDIIQSKKFLSNNVKIAHLIPEICKVSDELFKCAVSVLGLSNLEQKKAMADMLIEIRSPTKHLNLNVDIIRNSPNINAEVCTTVIKNLLRWKQFNVCKDFITKLKIDIDQNQLNNQTHLFDYLITSKNSGLIQSAINSQLFNKHANIFIKKLVSEKQLNSVNITSLLGKAKDIDIDYPCYLVEEVPDDTYKMIIQRCTATSQGSLVETIAGDYEKRYSNKMTITLEALSPIKNIGDILYSLRDIDDDQQKYQFYVKALENVIEPSKEQIEEIKDFFSDILQKKNQYKNLNSEMVRNQALNGIINIVRTQYKVIGNNVMNKKK